MLKNSQESEPAKCPELELPVDAAMQSTADTIFLPDTYLPEEENYMDTRATSCEIERREESRPTEVSKPSAHGSIHQVHSFAFAALVGGFLCFISGTHPSS